MLFAISCGTSFLVSHFTMVKSAAKIPKPAIRLRFNGALAAGLIGLVGLIGTAPVARAADDTARFFGQWKITVSNNGQTVTIISVHDADGFKNYVQTPSGFVFMGSGAFSAANGIWIAAAPPPNNGGTYHFVNPDSVVCNNAVGQTVTWRRDSTPLGPVAASHAQPEVAAPPSRPSSHDASAPAPSRNKRGLSPEPETEQGPIQPGNNFALVIGIDDYPSPLPRLKTAVNDAKSFAGLLSANMVSRSQHC